MFGGRVQGYRRQDFMITNLGFGAEDLNDSGHGSWNPGAIMLSARSAVSALLGNRGLRFGSSKQSRSKVQVGSST